MPRSRRASRIDWDEIARIGLPDLSREDTSLLGNGVQLDGALLQGLDADELVLDGAVLLDCRLEDGAVAAASARRVRLSSCELAELRLPSLTLENASVTNALFETLRVGAWDGHGAHLSRCTVRGSRLDYVNLRGATLETVQFVDCRIGELDLGAATVRVARFSGCEIGTLRLSAATLVDVDLTGTALDAVEGVDRLAGALIDGLQLQRLAPAFAAHLGVRVEGGS